MTEPEWRPRIFRIEEMVELISRGEEPDGGELVFVTEDMRLRDGRLADRDRKIFKDMRTGNVVPVPDIEEMTQKIRESHDALAGAVGAEPMWPNLSVWVDDDVAAYVRRLRVEERGSWRYVAGKVAERYGMDWGEDQPTGMELCEVAAGRLGENYLEGEWN